MIRAPIPALTTDWLRSEVSDVRRDLCRTFLLVSFALTGPLLAQDEAAEIDLLLKTYYEYGQFHGSALVADAGEVIYENGFGMANYEWEIPITPDTRFRLGSITKQFTATLILQLREEGRIDLDGKLSDYLPYYRKDTGDKVTIHQLLNHTSGIPSYTSLPGFTDRISRDPYEPREFVEKYCSGELQFEPGSTFSYNNSGYFLLGAIIEELTGKPYEQVLREKIFEPVGMSDTGYDHHESILHKRATGYARTQDGYVNADYLDMSIPYAAGSLYSTVEDLYKWDRALDSDEILSAESKDLMFTPGLDDYGYGFGIAEATVGDTEKTVRTIQHGGGINGFNTLITRLPETDGLIVLLGNVEGIQHLGEIRQGVINILNDQPWQKPRWSIAETMYETLEGEGIETAIEQYRELKESRPDDYDFSEGELNGLGYRLLGTGRVKDAIEVFKLNVEAFPGAFNPYDSLGEAYLVSGNEELALLNYRKSVELNPENAGGVAAIARIEARGESGAPEWSSANPWTEDDPLATSLIGSWSGVGTYDGNELRLTREWTEDLSGQFLHADMNVEMTNGAVFTSKSFWRRSDQGGYEVVWMDELGRFKKLTAESNPGSGEVSITHLDELAEGGPSWQRWVFELPEEGQYVERVYSQDSSGWRQVAEFTFHREED